MGESADDRTTAEQLLARALILSRSGKHQEALELYERAIALEPRRADLHAGLGVALLRLGETEQAEVACEEALALDPEQAVALLNLGSVRINNGHLEEAESLLRRALAVTAVPLNEESKGVAHFHLGRLLSRRHATSANKQDLQQAAVELLASCRHPAPVGRIRIRAAEAGDVLLNLYDTYADVDALVPAVESYRFAATLFEPTGRERSKLGVNLGSALRSLYVRERDPAVLEDALRELGGAVAAIHAEGDIDVQAPRAYTNLAAAHNDRYRLGNDPADSRAALELTRTAVALTRADDPSQSLRKANLASHLTQEYDRSGDVDALNQSVAIYESLLRDEEMPRRQVFSDLAGDLKARYLRLKDRADLVRSIELMEVAADRPDPRQPRSGATALANLAEGLSMLAPLEGDASIAKRAVEIANKAVTATPADDIAYANRISQKGFAELSCFQLDSSSDMLDDAIETLRSAVAATAQRPQFRPSATHRLANALRFRWLRTAADEDWESAVAALRAGLDALPDTAPDRPILFDDIGRLGGERFVRSGLVEHLILAADAYENAWALLTGEFSTLPASFKVGSARRHAAIPRRLVAQHMELARLAVDPSVAEPHLRRAWEVAEASKSRILADYLTRGQLPGPPDVPEALLEREQALLDTLARLDAAGFAQSATTQDPSPTGQSTLVARATAREELQRVWSEIAAAGDAGRAYVELRRPRPPRFEELSVRLEAASKRTVVLSPISLEAETIIFAVGAGDGAPTVARASWGDREWDRLLATIARELPLSGGDCGVPQTWHRGLLEVLGPVLDVALSAEHVVVLPSGPAMMVPWLAAFEWASAEDPGRRRVTVSLCPSVDALLARDVAVETSSGESLVVGDPAGDLEWAQVEARQVAARLGVEPLLAADATIGVVLPRLPAAPVAHFAGHGYVAAGAPLDSGLEMADGALTAREVLGVRLQAGLVVLSACDSGIVEGLGGEEFAGLSQAFLSAGAKCMIVSLWPVSDSATAQLMDAFYERYLLGGGAADALGEAAASLRSGEFGHPYYWAAFSCLTGAI